MGRMDPSHRFAQQMIDAFNNNLVDVEQAVSLILLSGPDMKVKLFKMAETTIDGLATDYDYDNFDPVEHPDHARVTIASKQLQEKIDEMPDLP